MTLPPEVWARRRAKLLQKLGPGVLLLPTAPQLLRNGDVHYEFRPRSDFTYLAGFPEPEAVLVAWAERKRTRAVLFVRPRDPARERWDGRRHGVRGAVKHFGVDAAHPFGELWQRLPELLVPHRRLFHTLGRDAAFDERLLATLQQIAAQGRRRNMPAHPVLEDPAPAIAEMRLIKEPAEIAVLERSAAITEAGHRAAMRAARAGLAEFQVQAELEAAFRRHGSRRNGYPSIVASGPNACILHYHENDRTLRRGDLLLLDAGAEYDGYTADVTRTFPISGHFSDAQRAVYGVVLRAQKAGIRAVAPGKPWNAPHRACVRALTRGLVELGVLRGQIGKLVAKQRYRPWFMHGTSHWLGMDVHDVGAYENGPNQPRALQPGMVLTVEPGLYFDPRDRKAPRPLRGIGVRIEDDVLVTRSGNRVLTAGVPKEIGEVEAACGERGV